MLYSMTYAVIILIYAMTAMISLLGIKPAALPRSKKFLLFTALPLIVVVSIFLMLFFVKRFPPLYPILVHLPIVIVLSIVSGRGLLKTFFVLLTAIFLCYPPSLVNILAEQWLGLSGGLSLLVISIFCVLFVTLVNRFMKPGFAYIMEQFGTREILFFCTVPLGYNILVYLLGQYRMATTVNVLRVVLFLSALGVYFLLMSVVKRTRELQQLQGEKSMVTMQLDAARQRFAQMKAKENQTLTYRHDMRHHLTFIGSCLADGSTDKIRDYLTQVQGDMDMLTPVRFCENETVSLILSSFADKAEKVGVSFSVEAKLPQSLALPDTELCAVLSNGLENAITAAALVDKGDRTIRVNCCLDENKLLIFMENTCVGKVTLVDGLPKASQDGHGFGTKSIAAIAQKRSGYFACEAQDGKFTLRVVLPLDK